MMAGVIQCVFPVVSTVDLDRCRDFYCWLLGFDVLFESGWYTALGSRPDHIHQIAFVRADHDSVPGALGRSPAGVLVTVQVDDAGAVHDRARQGELDVVWPLRDEPFGQRHFVVRDPSGAMVDVVQPIPPAMAFLRDVARWRRDHR
jgi:catechol 2,3-dioxygenase-like lactoylglutathione lyase family enzyme